MQIAVRRRILRHARRAQDDLVERCVGTLRQGFNLLLAEDMGRRAQVGNDGVPCFVQLAYNGDVAADTSFVCANAVPPQDSAANEITARYNLRFLFFFSVNCLIDFIFFSNPGIARMACAPIQTELLRINPFSQS